MRGWVYLCCDNEEVLGGAVVLSYIFFGYYSWLFLGPLPVTKLRPVAIFYVFFTFFTFVWYARSPALPSFSYLVCRSLV